MPGGGITQILADERPDLVNHQAAQVSVGLSVQNPAEDARLNVVSSLCLLEACVAAGVRRVIFASSGGAIYGEQERILCPEDAGPSPKSPYGIAKYATEHYLRYYSETHGIHSVILRYANIYGPRQDPYGEAGVIAIFCARLLDGKVPVINGDGNQIRDFVYVGDVAAANVLAADLLASAGSLENSHHVAHWVFNIGTGLETTINTLAQSMIALCSGPISVVHGLARAGEQRRSAVSWFRSAQVLGWHPRTQLEAGLQQTLRWFTAVRGVREGGVGAEGVQSDGGNESP